MSTLIGDFFVAVGIDKSTAGNSLARQDFRETRQFFHDACNSETFSWPLVSDLAVAVSTPFAEPFDFTKVEIIVSTAWGSFAVRMKGSCYANPRYGWLAVVAAILDGAIPWRWTGGLPRTIWTGCPVLLV
jgi:hypothetical protein